MNHIIGNTHTEPSILTALLTICYNQCSFEYIRQQSQNQDRQLQQ